MNLDNSVGQSVHQNLVTGLITAEVNIDSNGSQTGNLNDLNDPLDFSLISIKIFSLT